MDFKRLAVLVFKDLKEFFSSKAWIIALILPLFITFIYAVIYREAESRVYTIAYVTNSQQSVASTFRDPHLKLVRYQQLSQAKKALVAAKVDGVLTTGNSGNQLLLIVDKSKGQESALVVNALNLAITQAYQRGRIPRIKLEYLNPTLPVRWVTLPVWLLQVVLTICLLQAAAAVADERERQTLHSLLISPLSWLEYLLSKVLGNSVIGVAAVLLTLALTGAPLNLGFVLLYSLTGCMAYSALASVIGLLAPSALFARTTATVAYIISALPIMVRDLAFSGKAILSVFPSYLVLLGLEKALTPQPFFARSAFYCLALIMETAFLTGLTYYILSRKADL